MDGVSDFFDVGVRKRKGFRCFRDFGGIGDVRGKFRIG